MCVCIYIYLYIYAYTFKCNYMYICIHLQMYTYIHVNMYLNIHTLDICTVAPEIIFSNLVRTLSDNLIQVFCALAPNLPCN